MSYRVNVFLKFNNNYQNRIGTTFEANKNTSIEVDEMNDFLVLRIGSKKYFYNKENVWGFDLLNEEVKKVSTKPNGIVRFYYKYENGYYIEEDLEFTEIKVEEDMITIENSNQRVSFRLTKVIKEFYVEEYNDNEVEV